MLPGMQKWTISVVDPILLFEIFNPCQRVPIHTGDDTWTQTEYNGIHYIRSAFTESSLPCPYQGHCTQCFPSYTTWDLDSYRRQPERQDTANTNNNCGSHSYRHCEEAKTVGGVLPTCHTRKGLTGLLLDFAWFSKLATDIPMCLGFS